MSPHALPQWSTRGQPGQSLTSASSPITVIDTESQESVRTSTVPSKPCEDTGQGVLCPFFLGHLITVPTCPAFTSCSSHIPGPRALQGEADMFLYVLHTEL